MYYDLIIVSKSITKPIRQITQNCIDSARDDGDINVILVETGQAFNYTGVNTFIEYQGAFNYNRALNMGLHACTGEIHILANNDLIFHPGWSQIGGLMRVNNFDSASALSGDMRQKAFNRGDYIYEGFNIGSHFTGWCLFVTKEAIAKIGTLDESYDFWYSDNVFAAQLKKAGLRHGLFCNIRVDHIASVTLRTLPYRQQRRYSINARPHAS
jgi:hypothetical protein